MLVAVINKLCVPFFSNYQNSTSGCILAINKVFSISVRMRAGRFNSCSFPCLLVLMCRQQTRLPSLTLWPSHTHRPVVWKGTQWRSLLLAPIYTWTSLTHTDVQPHFLAIFSPPFHHTHTHRSLHICIPPWTEQTVEEDTGNLVSVCSAHRASPHRRHRPFLHALPAVYTAAALGQ